MCHSKLPLRNLLLLLIVLTGLNACDAPKKAQTAGDDGIIEFQILQMNDVYEISPSPAVQHQTISV